MPDPAFDRLLAVGLCGRCGARVTAQQVATREETCAGYAGARGAEGKCAVMEFHKASRG